ncbi:MAG: GTPase Era [Meiothermus sp.]|uniref:GTPase Era n=1 Tax=Meiothermus sp. TaxID=1955249 RepID=UPI0025DDDB9E|nr:GTPase Era [Meiothermus sp.]MCS7058337.1 GTPase Era [Meiothermus sp.]MCS7194298.1 GTPase Era [Meiothermus sp.]MCX7741250.1 GTPase Era [Meiothermus sp.]MDW8090686.1 GTPase Era [Meiothermus sp.]MDW8482559.1 GTPase Era [Meiothermus sp.]
MREGTTYSGFVALVGKPNVGKSTLLNVMLGAKVAPISPKPQTTRKRVRGVYTEDNRQIVFVDTPGWHEAEDALGEYMVRQITEALAEVNAVVWVVDLRHPPTPEDERVARALRPLRDQVPILLVGNKVDVAKYPEEAMRAYAELLPGLEVRAISAQDERDARALRGELLALLPEGPFFYPENYARGDQSAEEWAAEIVREEAMKRLKEEVPYAIATKTEEFELRENGMFYIRVNIYVERENHKPILIGAGGRMLREIGAAARKQLEIFLGRKVYLDLQVRVYPNWRKDPEALRELGYI